MRKLILLVIFLSILITFFIFKRGHDLKNDIKNKTIAKGLLSNQSQYKTPPPTISPIVNKKIVLQKKLNKRETLAYKRKTKVRENFFKDKVLIGGQSFYVAKSLKSAPINSYHKEMGVFFKKVGDFIYYKVPDMTARDSLKRVKGNPVLLNKSNGTLNVLSGNLIIRSKNKKELENLKVKYGFELIRSIPRLKTYFIKLKKEDNILELSKSLKNGIGIFSVTPEILGPTFLPQ
jgi:hypothetical protein